MRRHLTINGRRLSYWERRTPTARGTIVFLHAFPFNADMWMPQFDAVADRWNLIAPDFRGFGESMADSGDVDGAGLTLEDYAGDVIALIDRLGVCRPVIAGLSLGGYVVFAIMRLGEIDMTGLVLADTRAQADTQEGRAGRQRMIELVDREGAAGVAKEMLPKLLSPETLHSRSDIVADVRELMLAASPPGIKGALYRMMARPDSEVQLSAIRCPTLILVGSDDVLTPPQLSHQMQARIREASLETIHGAGHMSNLERSDAFNAALIRFLDRI